jgi:hypothetical protein
VGRGRGGGWDLPTDADAEGACYGFGAAPNAVSVVIGCWRWAVVGVAGKAVVEGRPGVLVRVHLR